MALKQYEYKERGWETTARFISNLPYQSEGVSLTSSMTASVRKRTFILAVFEVSERPVRRKADVQIVIQNNRLVNGWIKSPNNLYGPQLGPPVYFSGPANSDNIALRPDLATSD